MKHSKHNRKTYDSVVNPSKHSHPQIMPIFIAIPNWSVVCGTGFPTKKSTRKNRWIRCWSCGVWDNYGFLRGLKLGEFPIWQFPSDPWVSICVTPKSRSHLGDLMGSHDLAKSSMFSRSPWENHMFKNLLPRPCHGFIMIHCWCSIFCREPSKLGDFELPELEFHSLQRNWRVGWTSWLIWTPNRPTRDRKSFSLESGACPRWAPWTGRRC